MNQWMAWLWAWWCKITGTAPHPLEPVQPPCDMILARTGESPRIEFGFVAPGAPLIEAFADDQLFMVVSDPAALGVADRDHYGVMGSKYPLFCNQLCVDGWTFAVDIGRNTAGDNASDSALPTVMIVKFAKGNLPGLLADTALWHDPMTFCGEDGGRMLSVTLVRWCEAALARWQADDPDYCDIPDWLSCADWQGIVIINATVSSIPQALVDVAPSLVGRLMVAHHLCIDFTPIAETGRKDGLMAKVAGLIDHRSTCLRLKMLVANSRIAAFSAGSLADPPFAVTYSFCHGEGHYMLAPPDKSD